MRRELEDVRGKGVDKVIQHLRKLSALKKRCDFWEVFIADDKTIVIKNGDTRFGLGFRYTATQLHHSPPLRFRVSSGLLEKGDDGGFGAA